MSPEERRVRAEAIFREAIDLPAAVRPGLVAERAGGDEPLRAEVEALLRSDAAAPETFLGGASPRTIGPYRIVSQIGEGAVGEVYVAEQTEPVARRVAIKIVKLGIGTREILRRFEAERHLLALMDHPFIAHVYDAGVTDDGRSYFVMEHVAGEPITQFCDDGRLAVEDRLLLFLDVCTAVQHAHQRGVIHRDLKPSNILVKRSGSRGEPRIIDFGIAKAIDAALAGTLVQTAQGQMVGTPSYVCPEQIENGRAVDTRADIYSLGVVLYELLTGALPLDTTSWTGGTAADLRRWIESQAIERPSGRVASGAPARRRLRGDLDWITMKALEPDPDRRYAGVSELANDIRRHLAHEPVEAGPPGALYRAAKLVRRHRVAAAAAAAILVALAGGTALATAGMLHAQRAAAESAAVNDFMRDFMRSPARDGADARLVDVMSAAAARVPERFSAHPRLEGSVRELIGSVYAGMGMMPTAAEQLRPAVEILRAEFGPRDPRTLRAEAVLLGVVVNLGSLEEAEALAADLAPRQRDVLGARDEATIDTRRRAASILFLRGHPVESERALREVLREARAALGEGHLVTLKTAVNLAEALRLELGNDLVADSGATEAEMERILLGVAELPDGSDREVEAARLDARVRLAQLAAARGQPGAAADAALAILDRSVPMLGEQHWLSRQALFLLAKSRMAQQRPAEAAEWAIRAIEAARRGVGEAHPVTLSTMSDLLPILAEAGRNAEGEAYARILAEQFERLTGPDSELTRRYRAEVEKFTARTGPSP